MDSVIIEEILKNLKQSTINGEDKPKFSDSSYKAFDISKNNFHEIKYYVSKKKLAFVDGGNAEILKAPNFSLQFIRVYANIYFKNKKIDSIKNEFYALITSLNKEEIYYKTKLFPLTESLLDEKKLIFNSFDKTLISGINRVVISRIADVIRRFAELKLASRIIDKLEKEDIIVLDGDLQAKYTNESKYLDELYNKAEEKGILVGALSKTCNLLTEKGNSLSVLLLSKASLLEWYYYPIVEIRSEKHKADMYFLKLNRNSKYIFKFEIHNYKEIEEIFSLLKEQSKDPIFLGYPYGLIDADKNARVSNNELNYIKTKFKTKLGKEWEKLESYSNALNAHDVLDSVG